MKKTKKTNHIRENNVQINNAQPLYFLQKEGPTYMVAKKKTKWLLQTKTFPETLWTIIKHGYVNQTPLNNIIYYTMVGFLSFFLSFFLFVLNVLLWPDPSLQRTALTERKRKVAVSYLYKQTHWAISRSNQCSTTGLTKPVVCTILSVGWCIKKTLLLIGRSSSCGSSGFPLSQSERFFTICPTPYNRK